MSQREPTLNDVELTYHITKTKADTIIATVLRGYKENFDRVMQEKEVLQIRIEQLESELKNLKEPAKVEPEPPVRPTPK